MIRERAIVHEAGPFWVLDADNQYTVFCSGATAAMADSSYPHMADGLRVAIVRANYLAKRQHKGDSK